MKVEVSGYQFIFPQICACCGSPPDRVLTVSASKKSGKKVVRTQINTWDFPYCSRCIKHKNSADFAIIVVAIIAITVFIIFTPLNVTVGLFVALAISLPLYLWLWSQAKKLCSENCVCVRKAVRFVNWDGTRQVFEIVSPKYASAFMRENPKKLINLSLQARNLIEEEGHINRAKNVQSARRYRK
jgi:hypothetical protein